jgi:hypothetical protein
MRLSDAIALGRVLINEPSPFNYCHCAIGMALASTLGCEVPDNNSAYRLAMLQWPWLMKKFEVPEFSGFYFMPGLLYPAEAIISDGFFEVSAGRLTLERLIDWVRANEPTEAESVTESHQIPQEVEVKI